MANHRLPGMSVDASTWDRMTDRAEALGITRTELIRRCIQHAVEYDGAEDRDVVARMHADLVAARRQLAAVKAVLAQAEPSAAA